MPKSSPITSFPFPSILLVSLKIIGNLMGVNFSNKSHLKYLLTGICLCSSLPAFETRAQQILFWDPEGTNTSGTGFYSTWDTTACWTTNANLTTNLLCWTNGAIACFSAGNVLPTNINIFVNSTQNISGLYNGLLGASSQYLLDFIGSGALNLVSGQVVVATGSTNANTPAAGTDFNLPLTGPGQIVLQGPGPDFFYGADSYTGGTQFGSVQANSGTLVYFNKNSSFGTGPITILGGTNALYAFNNAAVSNEVDISGGSVALLGSPGAYSGPWNLLATPTIITSNQAGQSITISGRISGQGGLNVTGASELILSGTNTYTGPTIISNGFLALGSTGSIAATSGITLIPGTSNYSILDIPSFTFAGNMTLTSLGGKIGGGASSFNLGSQPVILGFTPTNFTGDTNHAPLVFSTPQLILSNNQITITNAATNPLGVGTYSIIVTGGLGFVGRVLGAPNPSVSVLGAGIVTNTAALLVVTNGVGDGYVNLIISPAVTSPPQVTAQLSSNIFQLTATVVPGAAYWVQSATNLTPPVTWINIATSLANSNGLIQFSNTNLGTSSGLFYRIAFP